MFRPKHSQRQVSSVRSDRILATAISRGEVSALGQFYDRYSPAIYALACQHDAAAAEHTVEQVFGEFWNMGQHTILPLYLTPKLLDLMVEAVSVTPLPGTLSTSDDGPPDALALLALLGRSDPLACSVLVLVCLNRVSIAVSATVLEIEQAVVRHALTSGFIWLRQFQPAITTNVTAAKLPAHTGDLTLTQAELPGGGSSSIQQAA